VEFLRKFARIYKKILEATATIIIILVTLAMLETALSRTIFHFPLSAIDKINVIIIIWACFLVNGPLVEDEDHIAVNLLPARLAGLPLHVLKAFISFCLLVAFVIAAYYGFIVFKDLYEAGVTYPAEFDIPQWIAFLPVGIGMVLAIPFVIHRLIISLRNIYRELKRG
jgi:TRAP-type C4-dicarboxylate transport system permease small subunit